MLEEMRTAGMDLRFVNTVTDKPTLLSVCFQYPDGSGGNITTSASAAAALTAGDIDAAESVLAGFEGRYIALAAPEVPIQARRHMLEIASAHSAFRAAAFTSAEVPFARYSGIFELVDLIALNQDEAQVLAGMPLDVRRPRGFLDACRDALLSCNPGMRVLVTAGCEGAFAFDGTAWDYCPALNATVASTAGAGDALFGAVLACLAAGIPFARSGETPRTSMAGRPLATALDFGSLLAAFTVTSPHTIHPEASLEALIAFAGRHGLSFDDALSRRFGGG